MRMKLCSTALAASATSPARAPCAVKNAKAAIAAAVRIMMSRLIAEHVHDLVALKHDGATGLEASRRR